MDIDILDALDDLGYKDTNELGDLKNIAKEGPTSATFTQVVKWLVQQIAELCGLHERVNAISSPSDTPSFLLELSGFLREYGCTCPDLTDGPVNDRLNSAQKCLHLLDYLTSELAAVQIIAKRKPRMLIHGDVDKTPASEEENGVASCMKSMLMALGIPKPPSDIPVSQLFNKTESKIKQLMDKHPGQTGKPLLKASLSDEEWDHIDKINKEMTKDYCVRKNMLLKRLDVTIQSFSNSEKVKRNQNKVAKVYQPIREHLHAGTEIGIPHILAARDDLTRMQKTSTGESRKECDINKVLIGKVPDRGGRAWELEPPPPEMPLFMKRDNAPRGHGPYGGRGRGGGGDYHRGRGGNRGRGRHSHGGGHHGQKW